MIRRVMFLVIAAVLLISMAVVAQTARGVIEATVTDDQGGVMPGVTVTLTGERVVGQQTTVTLADGTCRFRALLPGSYNLLFELGGFATFNREGIVIAGAQTIAVPISLTVAGVAETVTVSGESPMVDVKQTNIQATFDTVAMHDVPSQSDLWGILAQTPGVRMRGVDVGGSHKSQQSQYESFGVRSQNQVTLEGVNTTEGAGGTASYWDYYALEEYKISAASGADVEMASPGAFIEASVKSGGNTPSTLVHLDYEGENMVGTNVNPGDEKAERGSTGNPNLLFWELHADYGGPIIKDKFWIFGAYNYFKISKAISGIDPDDPEIIRQVEELGRANALDDGIFDTVNVKGTYQLSERDQLIGYINWGNKQKPNRGLSAAVPLESVLGQDFTWSSAKKMDWTRVWNDQLFTSFRFSFFSFTFPRSSRVDPQQRPPRIEDTTDRVSGAGWLPFTNNRHKPAVDLTANYYVPDAAGSHDFKFGYHYLRDSSRRGDNAGAGPIRYIDFNGAPFEVQLVDVPSLEILPAQTVTSALPNIIDAHHDFFVQDTWSPHRNLTINLGFRYGHQRIFYNPTVKDPILDSPEWFPFLSDIFTEPDTQGAELYRVGKITPRVGATVDLTGEGRSVIKVSYGRYYINIADGLRNVNPGFTEKANFQFNDLNGDGVLSNRAELGNEIGRSGGASLRFDPDTPLAFVDEYQLTFEHQFAGRETAFRASWVRKSSRDRGLRGPNVNLAQEPFLTVPFQVVDPGDPNNILNLLTTPADNFGSDNIRTLHPVGADADYDTLVFSFNRRFAGNFFMQAAFDYQWRDEPRSTNARTSPLTFDPVNTDYFQNHSQDLPVVQDTTTWNFKTLARYQLPSEIGLSTNVRVASGFTYARQVRLPIYAGTGVETPGARRLGNKRVYVEPHKNNRSETLPLWDVRVDKSWGLKDSRLTLMLDVYNLLNSSAETNFFLTTGNFRDIIAVLEPRTLKIGIRWSY